MNTFRSALLFSVMLAASCATSIQPRHDFLRSANHSSDPWLDAVVDAHFTDVRILHLPLTDAFMDMKIAITRADAPVAMFKVTLHAERVTRRQALWLLAQKYGLDFSVQHAAGQPAYISISRR